MGMRGVYEELAPPGRSVHIESFHDFLGPEARVTTLFEEKDGTTTMTVTVLSAAKEIRDAVLASGRSTARRRAMTGWRLCWTPR
jgi:hypothetical protein